MVGRPRRQLEVLVDHWCTAREKWSVPDARVRGREDAEETTNLGTGTWAWSSFCSPSRQQAPTTKHRQLHISLIVLDLLRRSRGEEREDARHVPDVAVPERSDHLLKDERQRVVGLRRHQTDLEAREKSTQEGQGSVKNIPLCFGRKG